VEAAWSLVDPTLGSATPVHDYDPNTWGPTEADRIIADDGGWHNPKPIADKGDASDKMKVASEDAMWLSWAARNDRRAD
jgi:hypothetical protein